MTLEQWLELLRQGINPVDGERLIGYHPDIVSYIPTYQDKNG